jgi:hypothetical protein
MPRKPNPPRDDPEQSKRFLELAKAVEASNDPKDFERVLKAIAPHKAKEQRSR